MKWFFTEMFKKDGVISSKIVMGITIITNAIVMGYVTPDKLDLINSLLLTGGTLLGVSIAKEIVSRIGKKDEK